PAAAMWMAAEVAGPLRPENDSRQASCHWPGAADSVTVAPAQFSFVGRPLRRGACTTLQPASKATFVALPPDLIRPPRKWPTAPAGACTAGTTWLGVSVAFSRYATALIFVAPAAVPVATTTAATTTARTPLEAARKPTRFLAFLISDSLLVDTFR